MENNKQETSQSHYDDNYFDWQKEVGHFGGWANSFKFKESVSESDVVIDFGCGGGFLLENLRCRRKIGIEINPTAAAAAVGRGVEHYSSPREARESLGNEIADVIVSNNALEHTTNPLQELKELAPLLRRGGAIHFFVPCDSIAYAYDPTDINYHLFSWSPQNLGNLFVEAGYSVVYVRPYIHKWPPRYRMFAKLGWRMFDLVCRLYGRIERSWFQVEIKAIKVHVN